MRRIIEKIDTERKKQGEDSAIIVENLSMVIYETIEKYYLISEGKPLLEVVLERRFCEMLMEMVDSEN